MTERITNPSNETWEIDLNPEKRGQGPKPEATAPETSAEAPEAKEDKEQTLREIESWLDGVNSWAEALAKSDMNTIQSKKEMMARQVFSHVRSIRESLDKLK